MKKYIRTENGIFEVVKEEVLCGVKFYDYETGERFNRIREEHVIAEGDAPEKLCDELVMIDKEGSIEIITYNKSWSFEGMVENLEEANQLTNEIYGAIWTSKGLIYVAKMNENGDLVLKNRGE